jgi:membrane-associated protease RseP (regulator of RpoE activity)
MGAVIAQAAGVADRKAMFDIAISGPLAGLVFALPIAWFGIQQSELVTIIPEKGALIFSDPLVLKWMIELKHGPLGEHQEVSLNPLLFAGWVGVFITALNLMPIGQLDGGHILYTLIGKRAHFVSLSVLAAGVGYMAFTQDLGYLLMVLLLLWMGPKHPPTADDSRPLGLGRHILGWVTLAFVLIGFTLRPIMIIQPTPQPDAPVEVQSQPVRYQQSV